MRDIIQKASDTDKQITIAYNAAPKAIAPSALPSSIAFRRPSWLSYLLFLGAISAGGLSIFSVAAILGTKSAQANVNEQAASPQAQIAEAQVLPNSSRSSDYTCLVGYHQDLANGESSQRTGGDVQTTSNITSSGQTSDKHNPNVWDASTTSTSKTNTLDVTTAATGTPYLATVSLLAPQDLSQKDNPQPECRNTNRTSTEELGQTDWEPTRFSTAHFPVFTANNPTNVETFHQNISTEFNLAPPVLAQAQPTTVATASSAVRSNSSSSVPAKATTDSGNLLAPFPAGGDNPTTEASANATSTTSDPALNSVEGNGSQHLAKLDESATAPATTNNPVLNSTEGNDTRQSVGGDASTPAPATTPPSTTSDPALNSGEGNGSKQIPVEPHSTTASTAKTPSPVKEAPAVHKEPGGASLLGGKLQAQSVEDGRPTSTTPSQTAAQLANPLAPSLILQGGFITQDETGARARLTGLYPISPNALFGGTVDLTTGKGFSDTPGTGLQLNELYFTGSLPSLPSLRLTVGLMDLTSYFDRNSFAKDSLTHFFNPVFQTNPALAAAGIGSRPGALLNWDITDNLQARAAAFSSSRSLDSFAIDAFAGELAFRAGNAIVRGTFATDRDAGRNNGFSEIYGIPRSNGDVGIRSSDRENAYGVNAEYFFPQIKMGLFGRYGHYDDVSLGKGADTYSVGLNFLDLFMKDDRLGFGYGRDLSNDDLRRSSGKKVPDVWELFYDIRVLSNLRAAVTLQARDEFSDIVAGFRVRTEFDLLRGLFR